MENVPFIPLKGHQLLNEAKRNPKSAFEMAASLERRHGSLSTAQHYYFLSAYGGYVPAMIRIACFYLSGQYIKYDENGWSYYVLDQIEGAEWLKKAASTGDDIAHCLLAQCYLDGIGVPKSVQAARLHLSHTKASNIINLQELNGLMIIENASGKLQRLIENL